MPSGILILAEPTDATAVSVATLLRRRHGPARVEIRTPMELALAPGWQHRLGEGEASTRIALHDGTTLAGTGAIFNRVSLVAMPAISPLSPQDRAYAQAELNAVFASFLAAARCRVVNRPSPAGLAGCAHRPAQWHCLAARAGLRTSALAATSSTRRFPPPPGTIRRRDLSWRTRGQADSPRPNAFGWYSEPLGGVAATALVVGDRFFGSVPESVGESCIRLARLGGADLVRFHFARRPGDDELAFTSANPFPAASEAAEVAAIAGLLEGAA